MAHSDRIAAARSFVRSCNVLLKQAGLYGLKHNRCAAQLDLTWKDLRKALAERKLVLVVGRDRIMVENTPTAAGAAEKSLVAFFATANIGRLDFDPRVTVEEFTEFIQICSTGKPVDVLSKLQPELGKTIGNIKVVEFRVLDTASLAQAQPGTGVPGSGGGEGEAPGTGLDLGVLLSDPHKLLQLIDAIPTESPLPAGGTPGAGGDGSGYSGQGGGYRDGEGSGGGFSGPGGEGGFSGTGEFPASADADGGIAGQGRPGGAAGGVGGGIAGQGRPGGAAGGVGGGGLPGHAGGGIAGQGRPGGAARGVVGGGRPAQGVGGGGTGQGGPHGAAGQSGGGGQGSGGGGFQEAEVVGVIQWLTSFAGGKTVPAATPGKSASNLQQAIQKLLPAKPTAEMRGALLMQVAEHVALRAVSDKYKTQGLNVTAIQQMLDRMNSELENLRKVLRAREEEMGRAGLSVESHADVLDNKFWQGVPEEARRKVLLSGDAWVLPPVIIRNFVQPLLAKRAEVDLVSDVLRNYCNFLNRENHAARAKTAAGVGKLADLYSRIHYLREVVDLVGNKLAIDTTGELAPALKESFVLLGQEAIAASDYLALDDWLCLLEELKKRNAPLAKSIRAGVSVDERVPEMVRIASEPPKPPEGLIEVLTRLPDPAARCIAERFAGCSTRDEGLRLASVLSVLGPVSIEPLREMLYRGSPRDAIAALGILTMLDPDFLRPQLSARLGKWTRAEQDAALRQISAAGTPERGSLLLDFLDYLDPFVLPLAVDEIGMAGMVSASKLMHLARGLGRARNLPYLRVKAIEALGRLGEKAAVPLLTEFLTERTLLTWQQPREIRVVSAQSLQRIDAEAAGNILHASGLTERELVLGPANEANPRWIRQRKYARVSVENHLVGSLELPSGSSSMKIHNISLGGGFGNTVRDPQGLTEATLDLFIGLRKLPTQVFIRRTRPHEICFEFVDISLEDRSRLREYVAEKCFGSEPGAKLKDDTSFDRLSQTPAR